MELRGEEGGAGRSRACKQGQSTKLVPGVGEDGLGMGRESCGGCVALVCMEEMGQESCAPQYIGACQSQALAKVVISVHRISKSL